MSKIESCSVIYVQGGNIMKKFILYIFIALMLFCLSSCMVKYSAPITLTDVYTEDEIELTPEEQEVILDILNKGDWSFDVPKCPSDYKFNTKKGSIGFIVEECMLVDYKRKRHCKITEEDTYLLHSIIAFYLMEAPHQHITGEWQYTEEHHWRITTCMEGLCDIDPYLEKHADKDGDNICDECSYKIPHEHTTETHYSEMCHWFTYTCGCPSNDIAELHTDYDEDNACDICSYIMSE